MARAKGQNYMYGAAILTAGVAIMKILGFIYKVPLGNILGDDGYSMFIATYNVYNVFLTLATAGLPVALSRMISEAHAQNRPMQARRTFTVAWWTFFFIGLAFSSVMFFLPELLADKVLHNPEAARSIWAMSPAVLLVCLVSAYRGYCQGHGNMIPTTVGQVIEVLVKVIVGLAIAAIIMHGSGNKPAASAGAIFGVTVGSLAALVYMFIFKRRSYPDEPVAQPDVPDDSMRIFRRFLRIGIPIALGASVMTILNLLDSSLCMGRLQSAAGFSLDEAKTLYGVYGKAQTLFNLPAAFITPLTISVVPAIVAAIVRGERDNAAAVSEDSMRIATVISMPMGVGLSVLCVPIMEVLYPGSHQAGPVLLCIMGVASFFVCLVLMENAVLQATGKEQYAMYAMIAGSVVKIVVNYFLVANREINIYGAPIGTLLSYAVMCVMNYIFMSRLLDKRPRLGAILLKPAFCSAAMGGSAWGVYSLLTRLLGQSHRAMLLGMGAAVLVAVGVYLCCTVVSGAFTKEDAKLIPGGEKLAKLLHLR